MDCLPQLHIAALHAHTDQHMNTFVPGLGLVCDNLTFGSYVNSLGKPTTYIAATADYSTPVPALKVGLFGGMASGYKYKVVPIAGVSVQAGKLQLCIIPPVRNLTPATLGVGIVWH